MAEAVGTVTVKLEVDTSAFDAAIFDAWRSVWRIEIARHPIVGRIRYAAARMRWARQDRQMTPTGPPPPSPAVEERRRGGLACGLVPLEEYEEAYTAWLRRRHPIRALLADWRRWRRRNVC